MQRRRTAADRSGAGASRKPRGRSRRDAATAIERAAPRNVARYDGYVNRFTGHGTARDRRTATRFRGEIVTDDEALDLWETEFLAARIIEAMPEEAYRRGWHLKLKDEELGEEVWNWADELGVEQTIIDAWEKENALGGSAIFPVVDGAQGDLSEPLDWDAISTVSALHVLEPRELMPMAFYEDLRSPHYGMPSLYMFTPMSSGFGSTIGMQMIHASRLVVFPGLRVTRQARPGQRLGWGISRLSRPKGVLADFGLAWGSAATLLHEHGFGVLEMDKFADIMAKEDGEEIVWRRVSTMMMMKSSLRALLVDSKDKYTRQTSALSGLAEVLNEFKVLMSAASDGMPVSVLMGQSQSGLRTGDDDMQTWYGNVEKRRSKRIRPRHAELLKFLLLAGNGPTGGREPDAWSIEYPALWSPSEKEVAETRKTDMDRAVAAVSAGIVSADDVAESFYGSDRYTGDIRINWERRKAQAAIDRERAEDLSEDDRAAMGRDADPEVTDDDELSQEDLAALDELAREFGDGGAAQAEEDEDEEDEDEEDEDEEDEDEEDEDEEEEDKEEDEDEDREDSSDEQWREDGRGYNPNRGKGGKFAAGAHKPRPTGKGGTSDRAVATAAVRVSRTSARAKVHAEKLKAAKTAKRAAVTEARAAIKGAKAASALAKKQPTAKNIKAAQVAANKATRAAAKVSKRDVAVSKHAERHATAKAAHQAAKAAHQAAKAAHQAARAQLKEAKAATATRGAPAAKPAKKASESAPALTSPHTPHPPSHEDASRGTAQHAPAGHTDEHLASVVHKTIDKVPKSELEGSELTGHQAFVSDVYHHMGDGDRAKFGGTLDSFKQKLLHLNRNQHVSLARADLVDMYSPHKVASSEINEHGYSVHFIEQPGR